MMHPIFRSKRANEVQALRAKIGLAFQRSNVDGNSRKNVFRLLWDGFVGSRLAVTPGQHTHKLTGSAQ